MTPTRRSLDLGGPPEGIAHAILAALTGLVLPLLLIPVVALVGHSEIVEESAKALAVFLFVLPIPGRRNQVAAALLLGFLFGASENVLYFNQLFQAGVTGTFWARFAWTAPMHAVTAGLIAASGTMGKRYLPLGLAVAILAHVLFNAAALAVAAR